MNTMLTAYTQHSIKPKTTPHTIRGNQSMVATFSGNNAPPDGTTLVSKRKQYTNLRKDAYSKAKKILNKEGRLKGYLNKLKAFRLYHTDEATGEKVWLANWKFAGKKWLEGFRESNNPITKATYVLGPIAEILTWDIAMMHTFIWPFIKLAFPGNMAFSVTCWSNASRDFITNMHIAEAMRLDDNFANSDPFVTSHLKKKKIKSQCYIH